MSLNNILKDIINDKRSGSSKIIKNTLELLKKVEEDERYKVCERIVKAHPSMAGLRFIAEFVKSNPQIEELKLEIEKMNSKTVENLASVVDNKVVTTLSRSHIVEKGLLKARKINVLESLPEKEGIEMARWLKGRDKEVEIFHDAFVSYAVKNCDLVVVGADTILKNGFINKTGTLPLALVAKHFNKEFYVASPSYKLVRAELNVEFDETFEFVDDKLVTALIWEGGIEEWRKLKEVEW
ncbi:hypothetical protein DRP05_02095 [Archaeoglobales archaeon]|nr:MAG: hypothetical protein DRP05_02095 [Archaeoglobales archaeon]